jgi:hypothetical protein
MAGSPFCSSCGSCFRGFICNSPALQTRLHTPAASNRHPNTLPLRHALNQSLSGSSIPVTAVSEPLSVASSCRRCSASCTWAARAAQARSGLRRPERSDPPRSSQPRYAPSSF